jgi:hypothetical protein
MYEFFYVTEVKCGLHCAEFNGNQTTEQIFVDVFSTELYTNRKKIQKTGAEFHIRS